jgi:hypothetical protein
MDELLMRALAAAARLLEKRRDGRWLSPDGREPLGRLTALRGVAILGPDQAGHNPGQTEPS